MTLQTLLTVASFTISCVGLVLLFFPDNRARKISIVVVISALVLLSGIAFYQTYQHQQRVEAVSEQILSEVRREVEMTFDQLYENLYYVEFPVVNEALDYLVNSGKLSHRILELRSDGGAEFRVRGYYVK